MGSLNSSKVEGKIVVCERGGNARVEKGAAVKLAGGSGMILANTAENGEELLSDAHLIPATMVGEAAGNKILEYIKTSQSPTATISFRGTVISPSPPSPKVAAFSSRGPHHLTAEILKPDVIAPGVNILAGWTGAAAPTDLDIDPRRVDYNIISGTSMACPHVSGLAALLKKAYPNWSPAAIKSALMTTAYTLDNSGNTINDLATGEEASPFVYGAGHVDPNRALNPGLVYDIENSDYVSFLCSIGYDSNSIAIFLREPTSSDVCESKFATPGDLNYPSFSVVFHSNDHVVKYQRRVKNVGTSADAVYVAKVNAPPGVEISISPSKLEFSAVNQTLNYEIVFASDGLYLSGIAARGFGSIEWSDGIHLVRSPIAVRWLQGLLDSI
ncbi:Subtilisin-like protease SBT1.7 [Hibiscus syriacus]|uniref:Subtilisin-like protease SBT1.7 n=1 Tax=Hibiscus syriacus TaxID=106335 RepID=A0A6A3CN19_HIBSY|nr:Subtilisin-like protease SBT1.7 [Hibiscus syriacus]